MSDISRPARPSTLGSIGTAHPVERARVAFFLNLIGVAACLVSATTGSLAYLMASLGFFGAAAILLIRAMQSERDSEVSGRHRPGEVFTDHAGRLIGAERGDATGAFDALLPDGAKIAFAMVSSLSGETSAVRHVTDHQGRDALLLLELAGPSRLRWKMLGVPDMLRGQAIAFRDAPFGHVRVAPDGTLGTPNVWLARQLGRDCETLQDILLDLPPATGRIHRAAFDPQTLLRALILPDNQGGGDLLLFPVEQNELAASHPDQLLERMPIALARLNTDGVIELANSAAVKLIGPTFAKGASVAEVLSGMAQPIPQRVQSVLTRRVATRPEIARLKGTETDRFFQVSFSPIRIGNDLSILMIASDATELKTLEAQFVQSQKMQAVGQLAGGVAHDFNNLLTALSGHCDLLLLRRSKGDPDYADLMQIRQNANRAAALVRQLLAFSRKQTLQPRDLDLGEVLGDILHLLTRLMREKVSLHLDLGGNLPNVRVDLRQFEQVIMNLVVNARDAMPDGGEVTIAARGVTLDAPLQRDRATVEPGSYAVIEVRDTGTGIPQRDLNKVFEPFFTTKRVGEGTGLGLSTAYGIIKQTGGFIFVDSPPGEGTTFTIYLPHVAASATAPREGPALTVMEDMETREGTVLLVEDEAPVRAFAARALQLRGYQVIEAESGEEALEIVTGGAKFDVVITDVIMPGSDGPAWVREARRDRPDMRVIFMSGYAEDIIEDEDIAHNATFVAKPFSLGDLILAVKRELDAAAQSADS